MGNGDSLAIVYYNQTLSLVRLCINESKDNKTTLLYRGCILILLYPHSV